MNWEWKGDRKTSGRHQTQGRQRLFWVAGSAVTGCHSWHLFFLSDGQFWFWTVLIFDLQKSLWAQHSPRLKLSRVLFYHGLLNKLESVGWLSKASSQSLHVVLLGSTVRTAQTQQDTSSLVTSTRMCYKTWCSPVEQAQWQRRCQKTWSMPALLFQVLSPKTELRWLPLLGQFH